MTRTTEMIYKKAMKLPPESRVDLVARLLESILKDERSGTKKIDKAWAREAKSRFEAFLSGEIEARSMNDVIKTLRKRHAS